MNVKADKPYLFFSFFFKKKINSLKKYSNELFSFTGLTREKKGL